MSAAKYRPSRGIFGTIGGLAGAIVRPLHGRGVLLVGLVALGGMAWGAAAVWQHVREHVATQDDYHLEVRDIEITPSPPWVRSNVKGEALRDAGLTGPLSILDDQLIERINRAFSLHPWVATVRRVSKRYPAHVDVELEYRRPVAMVEVPGGLYPVDVEGVLLPSEDFSPLEARLYPRLAGVASTPLGSVGSRWGDPVVVGGAHIAEVLGPAWADLKLRSIRWQKPPAGSDASAPASYELLTASGHVIQWGAAPGSGPTGEPSGAEKLARLTTLARQYGSLDAAAADSPLDLRQPGPTGRTASRSP